MAEEFNIPVGSKFACIGLRAWVYSDRPGEKLQPLNLGNGLWVVFESPFQLDDFWKEWLGSIHSERFLENNLFLLTVAPSERPDILDDENQRLSAQVHHYYLALVLHGQAYSQQAPLLSGANTGKLEVRQVGTLNTHYHPPGIQQSDITKDTFTSAAQVREGIRKIISDENKYRRLKRGLHAWSRAEHEQDAHYRLHQFVRAIEALIKPSQMLKQLTEQFIHRAQFFTGHPSQAKEMISAFYELRCAAEHMYELEPLLTGKLKSICSKYPTFRPTQIIMMLTYQVEVLASFCYARILKDHNLQQIFIDDDSIGNFWKQSDDVIRNTWGETVDLEAAASNSLIEYL